MIIQTQDLKLVTFLSVLLLMWNCNSPGSKTDNVSRRSDIELPCPPQRNILADSRFSDIVFGEPGLPGMCRSVLLDTSTQDLVEAFNRVQNEQGQLNLNEWVDAYVTCFLGKHITTLNEDQLREYVHLAKIQPRTLQGQNILRRYLRSFFEKIEQNQFGEKYLIRAFSDVLEKIDKNVFEDTSELIRIGNVLLGKIIPNETVLNRNNYPTHETILTALHSTLLLISQLATEGWSDSEESLYQNLQAKISAIKTASKYYPVTYYSQLLEGSLTTLRRIEPRTFSDCLDDAWQTIKTIASVYQVARGMLSLEIDIKSWEEAYQQLQATGTQLRSGLSTFLATYRGSELSWSWHDHLLDLTSKSISDFDSEGTCDAFKEKLESLEQLYQDQRNERLFLRYGVVRQLTAAALLDSRDEIRDSSLRKLLGLTDTWGKDPEIAEGILEGLSAIARHGYDNEAKDTAINLLTELEHQLTEFRKKSKPKKSFRLLQTCGCFTPPDGKDIIVTMDNWLGDKTLRQKLGQTLYNAPVVPEYTLFKEAKQVMLGKLGKSEETTRKDAIQEVLKDAYKKSTDLPAQDFYSLLVNKKTKISSGQEEIRQNIRKPIDLKDLFRLINKQPGKLLIVGEAGVGKTALVRKLAYDWADSVQAYASDLHLDTVYLLCANTLRSVIPQPGSTWTPEALSDAIVSEYLPFILEIQPKNSHVYKSWHGHIVTQLKSANTLVILDGIEDISQVSGIVGNHKLIVTTRAAHVAMMKTTFDYRIDHMGLKSSQLIDGVTDHLRDFRMNCEQRVMVTNLAVLNMFCFLRRTTKRQDTVTIRSFLTTPYSHFLEHCKVSSDAEKFLGLEEVSFSSLSQAKENFDLVGNLSESSKSFREIIDVQQHRFPHIIFQEYLASRFVHSNLDKLISKDFIKRERYTPKYQQMLAFIVSGISEGSAMKTFLELVNEAGGSSNPGGLIHLTLQLRLFNEWLRTAIAHRALQDLGSYNLSSLLSDLGKELEYGLDQAVRFANHNRLNILLSALENSEAFTCVIVEKVFNPFLQRALKNCFFTRYTAINFFLKLCQKSLLFAESKILSLLRETLERNIIDTSDMFICTDLIQAYFDSRNENIIWLLPIDICSVITADGNIISMGDGSKLTIREASKSDIDTFLSLIGKRTKEAISRSRTKHSSPWRRIRL